MIVRAGLQDAHHEDGRDPQLFGQWNLQMPNSPDWKQQYEEIRNDIRDSGDDEVEIGVDACPWDIRVPGLGYRIALEDNRYIVGKVEADIQHN